MSGEIRFDNDHCQRFTQNLSPLEVRKYQTSGWTAYASLTNTRLKRVATVLLPLTFIGFRTNQNRPCNGTLETRSLIRACAARNDDSRNETGPVLNSQYLWTVLGEQKQHGEGKKEVCVRCLCSLPLSKFCHCCLLRLCGSDLNNEIGGHVGAPNQSCRSWTLLSC